MKPTKDWIQTYTGRQFWPTEPHYLDICIEDIAHSLSMQCRYTGHCKFFYSVAEHSVHVSHFLPPALQLEGLLHDATEAYLTDVPRPIKPFLAEYKGMEQRIRLAIACYFGLQKDEAAEVQRVDSAILADEMAQLMAKPPADWRLPEPPLGVTIEGWLPERAKAEFLKRFHKLLPA